MKIKTSETTPIQINWLVAEALNPGDGARILANEIDFIQYHEDWAQGGPIIERERLQVLPIWREPSEGWAACVYDRIFEDDGTECYQCGPTPLIAAMRCFVASRFGDEVEVTDELC